MDHEIPPTHFQYELSFRYEKQVLVGYADSNMAGDMDSRKSTLGYLITCAGKAASLGIEITKGCYTSYYRSRFHLENEACTELLWMNKFEKSFVQSKNTMYFSVIVKVLSTLVSIQYFMQEQSILM